VVGGGVRVEVEAEAGTETGAGAVVSRIYHQQ